MLYADDFYQDGYHEMGNDVVVASTNFTKVIYAPMDDHTMESIRFNEFGEPNEEGAITLIHQHATAISYELTVTGMSGRINVVEL